MTLTFTCSVSLKYAKEAMERIEREKMDKNANVLVSLLSNPKLTLDECLTMTSDLLSGGVDTVRPLFNPDEREQYAFCISLQTAHTASYALYHLAENPEVQKKLQEEIDDVLKDGEPLDMNTFDKLPYMKAVVKESQR
jgi:hypothetical protein